MSILDRARKRAAAPSDHVPFGDDPPPTPKRKQPPAPSTNGKPSAKPSATPPPGYRPFPVDALPMPLQRFVSEGAQAIGCDEAFIALPALAVAAGLVGMNRRVRLKRTWREPAVIWAVVVAEPSSMKTPAFEQVRKPLIDLQERFNATFASEWNRHQQALDEWRDADKGTRGEKPKPPCKREAFVSDCTIERIAEILSENPRGTLLARDELSAWIGSFTRYRKSGSDAPGWMECWAGGTLKVQRKTGEPRDIWVKHAAVSVTGTIQPGILMRALSSDLFDAGMPYRLLFAMPPRRQKQWQEIDLSEDAEAVWATIVERLANIEGETTLDLAPDAKRLWVQHYNRGGRAQFDASGPMQAALGKLEAYAARLALVHYLIGCASTIDEDARGPIPLASMAAGIKLADWFAGEAERVFLALDEDDEARELRALAEKIAGKGGRITVRDLQNGNGKRYRTADDADEHLQALVAAGYGRWEQDGRQRVFLLVRQSDSPTVP